MQKNICLLIGSNLGNSQNELIEAANFIDLHLGTVTNKSSIYSSKSWGFKGNDFLNQVITLKSTHQAQIILSLIKFYEKERGRLKKLEKYEDRVIDIDILFYGDEIIETPELTIPHLLLHDRHFTLEPLNEILPNYVHPKLNKSINSLLNSVLKDSSVKKI